MLLQKFKKFYRIKNLKILALFGIICSFFFPSAAISAPPLKGSVKVGILIPLTGASSSLAQNYYRGIKTQLDLINEVGVLKKKLEIVVVDSKSLESDARAAWKELVVKHQVTMILGELTNKISQELSQLAERDEQILLMPLANHYAVNQLRNWSFPLGTQDEVELKLLIQYARRDLKKKTAVILLEKNSDYGNYLALSFDQNWKNSGGTLHASGEAPHSYFSYDNLGKDFFSLWKKVKSKKPDVVFIPGYREDIFYHFKQADLHSLNPVFLAPSTWEVLTWRDDTIPQDALYYMGEGQKTFTIYHTQQYHADEWMDSSYEKYKQNFTHYLMFKNSRELHERFRLKYIEKFQAEPDQMAALGFDHVGAMAFLLNRANSTDKNELKRELQKGSVYSGITGPISFSPDNFGKHHGVIFKSSLTPSHLKEKKPELKKPFLLHQFQGRTFIKAPTQ